jgi:hypothetical protein
MEIISPESRKINSFLCANKMNTMFLIGKNPLALDEIKHLQESGEKIGLHKNAIAEIEKVAQVFR